MNTERFNVITGSSPSHCPTHHVLHYYRYLFVVVEVAIETNNERRVAVVEDGEFTHYMSLHLWLGVYIDDLRGGVGGGAGVGRK